ncbi:MAG: hypothetical protein CSA75_02225, partial [Sorangium cellulosum]
DRGPKSCDVINTLIELGERYDVYPLLGNHETLLLAFVDDPTPTHRARFTYNGGGATLQSYCSSPGKFFIPPSHIQFFRSLPLAYQNKDHIFVHAGLPEVPIVELDTEKYKKTMLWVRAPFHESAYVWEKLVVHGHSRVKDVYRDNRRVNLDTGCVYRGKLSALHLPSGQLYEVPRARMQEQLFLREPAYSRRMAVRYDGQVDVTLTEPSGLPACHTLNYNEFGMLIEFVSRREERLLAMHAQVAGALLPHDERGETFFQGQIVRIEEIGGQFRYALRFDRPVAAST